MPDNQSSAIVDKYSWIIIHIHTPNKSDPTTMDYIYLKHNWIRPNNQLLQIYIHKCDIIGSYPIIFDITEYTIEVRHVTGYFAKKGASGFLPKYEKNPVKMDIYGGNPCSLNGLHQCIILSDHQSTLYFKDGC